VRACSRRADAIIATDAALEPVVARHLRPRPGQMHTIPNGIDLRDVGGAAGPADGRLLRERLGIGSGETLLVTVGRLEFNKGLDVLADALSRVARPDGPLARHGWRWVIVGAGPFKGDLERAVAERGLASHVLFTGRIGDADLHAWYEAATLFVHPTRYEGSSLVTLEAMAHRKAVVATRAGGLPDKVRPGVNGWLVDPGDPAGLSVTLEDALSDPMRLLAFGTKGRQIVESEFAWSVLVEKYLDLYDRLLTTDT
jgi:glycosyltransferase involved in cell wall biosynthesis